MNDIMNNTAFQNATIQNLKDMANNINHDRLLCSMSNLIFCYENNRLEDEEIYNLSRDVFSLLSDMVALKDEIATLKTEADTKVVRNSINTPL